MQTAAFRAMGLKAVYVPLPCDRSHLATIMSTLSGAQGGGNVTIPYKTDAVDALDHPSELVRVLGACNTFWGNENGIWGDNTDVPGIRQALTELDAPPTVWLVVGTGGSARAAVEAAREVGAAVAVKSRSVVKAARFRDWLAGRGEDRIDEVRDNLYLAARNANGLKDEDLNKVIDLLSSLKSGAKK